MLLLFYNYFVIVGECGGAGVVVFVRNSIVANV